MLDHFTGSPMCPSTPTLARPRPPTPALLTVTSLGSAIISDVVTFQIYSQQARAFVGIARQGRTRAFFDQLKFWPKGGDRAPDRAPQRLHR